MPRRLVVLLVAAALAGAGATAGVHAAHRGSARTPAPALQLGAARLPATPVSALHVGKIRLLDRRRLSMWATVLQAATVRSSPGHGAVIARLDTQTPEQTTNVVRVLRVKVAAHGTWSQINLASSSAERIGWVPRSALGALHLVDTRLDVDLTHLRLTLFANGRRVFSAPIGVGKAETPTPRGHFYVRDELTRYSSPFYGPLAFGTSAESRVLTDWPAGGYIGIHGTDEPSLVPGRISHGCIRLRNDDLLALARLLPIGTPITIH